MSQYPNYLQQQIPSYQTNYQMMPNMMNMYSPYVDRINQLQQFQQNLQANQNMQTIGKMVESIDIVKTTDIPMDGNMYYFPKADGTEVYGKRWLANGQTQILAFKPILDAETDISTPSEIKFDLGALDEFKTAFMEQFESVTERLDKIEKAIRPISTNKSKKEIADD